MLQECLEIVGVDDTNSHISALKKYKDKEERLNRILLADEKLRERLNETKVTKIDKDIAVQQLTTSHPAFEILSMRRKKPNKRKQNQRRNRQNQSEPPRLSNEHTSPTRQRVSLIINS